MPYADPERQRKYMREWIARRRTEWIAANGPCAKCGSTQDLEIDHVDPKSKSQHLRKHRTGTSVWSWTAARRAAELAKCQVLCGACHKVKSAAEAAAAHPLFHGTHAMYTRGRCRCRPCKDAHAATNALYR